MQVFMLLAALTLLLSGCASEQPPVPVATSALPSTRAPIPAPSQTPMLTPAPTPGATESTGVFETPCDLGHTRPVSQRQKGFLEWSPDGSALVFDIDQPTVQAIWELGVDGSYARRLAATNPLPENTSSYGFHADLSPDGLHLVYSTCEYEKDAESSPRTLSPVPIYELAIVSVDGGESQRLTESIGPDQYPAWSPDGSRIAYIGTKNSSFTHFTSNSVAVWIVPVGYGTGGALPPWALDIPQPGAWAPVWSPDSKRVAIVGFGVREPGPVHVVDVGVDVATTRVVGATHISPSWSPDGTRLVFAENSGPGEAATAAVRIVDLEGTGSVDLPEMEGHVSQVAWHPDGSEILVAVSGRRGGLRTISPDGHIVSDVYRSDDPQFLGIWSDGLAWSPDGATFAIRIDYPGPHGYVYDALAIATRGGSDWRILSVGGDSTRRGFILCNMPAQGPTPLSDDHWDLEEHCEPAEVQKP